MALPVMTPLLAFFLAIPMLRLPPLIIVVEIVRRLLAPTVVGWVRRRSLPSRLGETSAAPAEQAT